MPHKHSSVGRVCLVGAGPGDPGLLTCRGRDLLQQADVVVYDALANPVLLELARPDAQRLNVGKRGGDHTLTQDQINDLLVEKAREGCLVVRLKGGDPYLFGRGAEEAAYLAERGVACEIVAGVTSGIAAPAAAGIPVTHREVASTVTFVTGHEDPTKPDSAIDYVALAKLIERGGTVCFYMGVARLGAIAQQLQAGGAAADTPVALVQWGTRPKQRSIKTTLTRAVDDVQKAGIGSPSIIVVGKVVGLDAPGLDYFTRRALFGQRIVITRTRQQASALRSELLELGAEVLEAPTIQIVPSPDDVLAKIDDALTKIDQYDWLVLTSANGVAALAERLQKMQRDARHLAGVQIAAIGDGTERALREILGIRADLVPTRFVAESLAGDLIADHGVTGKRFLLLRADIARPILPQLLSQAGAQVDELAVYETQVASKLPGVVLDALRDGEVDWITFTSASTARNMAELLGDEADLLKRVKLASIGPITSDALRELGLEPTIEAQTHNIDGLIEALLTAAKTRTVGQGLP